VRNALVAVALVLLPAAGAVGKINPDYTPKHLVDEAEVIFVGTLTATDKGLQWKVVRARPIKGEAPAEHVVRVVGCAQAPADMLVEAFRAGRPVVVFVGTLNGVPRAYVHTGGTWLNASAGGKGRWNVTCYAAAMSATYAGGTDMLARMSAYLVHDRDGDVPVTAGVRWSETQVKVGQVPPESGPMAAVEIGTPPRVHLFVASPEGDRLFRSRFVKDDTVFEDVTAAARLDSRSRRFAWVDLDRDGLADLVGFDGKGLFVRLARADGTFKVPEGDWSVKLPRGCTALTPCGRDGRPGVLVSTDAGAFHLAAEPAKGWTKQPMPPAKGQEYTGRLSPCIVADLDNDGFADVLQPGEQGGVLWRGTDKGLATGTPTDVGTGAGIARAVLGDFNEDGALDVFLPGSEVNSLWENDGKGRFRNVFRYTGSLHAKCPAGAAEARMMDLNHDGRQDLCLIYLNGNIAYHFNRGFRAFGEEGEVKLPGLDVRPGQRRVGQKAMASADFNDDSARDLVVMTPRGVIVAYMNYMFDRPGLRLRLPRGVTGPVTVSCWQGERRPACCGAVPVGGHTPPTYVGARYPGKCTVRWTAPGKGPSRRTVEVTDGARDLVVGGSGGAAPKK